MDDLDQLAAAVSTSFRKLDERNGAGDHLALLWGCEDGDTSSTPKLEQALLTKDAQSAKNRVLVDADHSREVSGRRESLAHVRFAVSDRAPDGRSHLIVKIR